MREQRPNTGQLAVALTDCFKGAASNWLSEIIDEELNWEKFVELYKAKYCHIDTPAAIIHQTITAQVKDGDTAKLVSKQLLKIRGAF